PRAAGRRVRVPVPLRRPARPPGGAASRRLPGPHLRPLRRPVVPVPGAPPGRAAGQPAVLPAGPGRALSAGRPARDLNLGFTVLSHALVTMGTWTSPRWHTSSAGLASAPRRPTWPPPSTPGHGA